MICKLNLLGGISSPTVEAGAEYELHTNATFTGLASSRKDATNRATEAVHLDADWIDSLSLQCQLQR